MGCDSFMERNILVSGTSEAETLKGLIKLLDRKSHIGCGSLGWVVKRKVLFFFNGKIHNLLLHFGAIVNKGK